MHQPALPCVQKGGQLHLDPIAESAPTGRASKVSIVLPPSVRRRLRDAAAPAGSDKRKLRFTGLSSIYNLMQV